MIDDAILAQAEALLAACRARALKIATAESCTGGLVAGALTAIAGSSEVVDRGFVTYSNEAKREVLGVPADTLAQYGAVSEQTARAMAEGALAHSRAQVALSVTGIAGPGGGTPQKPVGMVCFGWARADGETLTATRHFPGDRAEVRRRSIETALQGVLDLLEG